MGYQTIRQGRTGTLATPLRGGGSEGYGCLFTTPNNHHIIVQGSSTDTGYEKTVPSKKNIQYGGSTEDIWILETDSAGNPIRDRVIGGNKGDGAYSILAHPKGGYLLIGGSNSDSAFDKTEPCRGTQGLWNTGDLWLIRTDSDFNVIAQKTVGGTDFEWMFDAVILGDGSVLVAGYSLSGVGGDKQSPNFGDEDYWVVKLKEKPLALIEIDLSGKTFGTKARLQWRPSIQASGTRYYIERQPMDGHSLETIAEIPADGQALYTYQDSDIPVTGAFYRITALTSSGESYRSRIIQLKPEARDPLFRLRTNIVQDVLEADYVLDQSVELTISDAGGKIILRENIDTGIGILRLPIEQLTSGVYALQVMTIHPNAFPFTQPIPFIKQ